MCKKEYVDPIEVKCIRNRQANYLCSLYCTYVCIIKLIVVSWPEHVAGVGGGGQMECEIAVCKSESCRTPVGGP